MKELIAELYTITKSPLQQFIEQHPHGVKEFDLLSHMSKLGYTCFERQNDKDASLDLFHRHFLLFHCLYKLQQDLKSTVYLEIHCLCIRFLPLRNASVAALSSYDGEREYYLDVGQLERTSTDQVHEMLNGFWKKFEKHFSRNDALEILGLDATADAQAIELQYRRLAMQHHPDRGGDHEKFCEVKDAWNMLR